MNLVAGVMTFPVPAGFDASLARSEDAVCWMEVVSQGDLAAVLTRNLAISRGFRVVDTLLLILCVIGHYFFCSYFLSIFDPTSLHIPYPTFLLYVIFIMCSFPYAFHTHKQTTRTRFDCTTGHQTTCLLGY